MSRNKTEVKKEKDSTTKIGSVKKPIDGFLKFLAEYSIIGMALGIIIGATVKDTVDVLVEGIITPAIQLIVPSTQLQGLVVDAGKAQFLIGDFLESLLQLLVIMALLYFIIGVLMKRSDLISKKSKK